MNVLGVSCFYHDAAACLAQDARSRRRDGGALLAQETRYQLSRRGGSNSVCDMRASTPIVSIPLSFTKTRTLNFSGSSGGTCRPGQIQKRLSFVPSGPGSRRSCRFGKRSRGLSASLRLNVPLTRLAIISLISASAFYCSPFPEGGNHHARWYRGVGNLDGRCRSRQRHSSCQRNQVSHSLGLLYSVLTAYLGFRVNNSEYKVMGLAGFGQPTYRNEVGRLITLHDDGSFSLSLEYFDFWNQEGAYSPKLVELLGPPRRRDEPVTERHMNIAASLQAVTEDVLFALARAVHRATGQDRVCLAGGVLLNSLANGRFLDRTPFKEMYVPPAPGDDGGAMGRRPVHQREAPEQWRTHAARVVSSGCRRGARASVHAGRGGIVLPVQGCGQAHMLGRR